MARTLWTIGHSTRPIEELLELLQAHEIARLVDVRTIARSRFNPQFNREALRKRIELAGLSYAHEPKLGGLRKSRPDSINAGWKNASFRGYADYMQTDEFWKALEALMAAARNERTAVMCAEAVPWRCHRSLIADALVSRGWTVRHILTTKKADQHELTAFAKLDHGKLTYPAAADSGPQSRLF
jgi:uncharacterized protein (DUF488 family)